MPRLPVRVSPVVKLKVPAQNWMVSPSCASKNAISASFCAVAGSQMV
jgi:hypothetical protein